MNDTLLLECLHEVGVDNWEGYAEAVALYHQREAEMNDYSSARCWSDTEMRD